MLEACPVQRFCEHHQPLLERHMPLKVRKLRRAPRPGSLKDLSPLRILTQIIVLQLAYYASAMVLIVFTALTAGRHMSVDLFLGWHNIRGDITEGWMFGLCWILNSPIGYVLLGFDAFLTVLTLWNLF